MYDLISAGASFTKIVINAPEDEDLKAFSQPAQASFFHMETRPGLSSTLVKSEMAVLRSPDFNALANFSTKDTRSHPHDKAF